jgi:hypothetical protein
MDSCIPKEEEDVRQKTTSWMKETNGPRKPKVIGLDSLLQDKNPSKLDTLWLYETSKHTATAC